MNKAFECKQPGPIRREETELRRFQAEWDNEGDLEFNVEVSDHSTFYGVIEEYSWLSREDAVAFARWILETAGPETDPHCS